MSGAIERVAYAIARGVTRAYLDVVKERSTGVEEVANDEDRARAARLRDAVNRLPAGTAGDSGSDDPAPGGD